MANSFKNGPQMKDFAIPDLQYSECKVINLNHSFDFFFSSVPDLLADRSHRILRVRRRRSVQHRPQHQRRPHQDHRRSHASPPPGNVLERNVFYKKNNVKHMLRFINHFVMILCSTRSCHLKLLSLTPSSYRNKETQ